MKTQAKKWHLKTKIRADHHQIWREGKGASGECHRQTGNEITKPEVMPHVEKITFKDINYGPITTKFDVKVEEHPGSAMGKPEVMSRNRK